MDANGHDGAEVAADIPPAPANGAPFEALLNVRELAELLKINPSTVRDHAAKGLIPCMRIGNRFRFEPARIRQWIKVQQQQHAQEAADGK
jgi:excisionase family DNA binding protein